MAMGHYTCPVSLRLFLGLCLIKVATALTETSHSEQNNTLAACRTMIRKLEASPSFFHVPHTDNVLQQSVILVTVAPPASGEHSACTFDVGDVINSEPVGQDMVLYLSIQCLSDDVRLVMTNRKGVVNNHLIGYLTVAKCPIYWRDVAVYGTSLDFRVLFFSHWQDRFEEEQQEYPKPVTDSCVYAPGLQNVGTLGLFMVDVGIEKAGDSSQLPTIFTDERWCWPEMAEVSFHGNSYTSIPSTLEKTMPQLQSIEARDGKLTVPPAPFPWDQSLMPLPRNLSRSAVGNDHYSTAEGIQVEPHYYRRLLTLDDNSIDDLSDFEFQGFLHKISLIRNGLKVLGPRTFSRVHDLEVLDLRSNLLEDIPDTSLLNLHKLKQLNLEGNRLKTIAPTTFSDLSELIILNLADNRLEKIVAGQFSELRSLEQLDLSRNLIRTVDDKSIFLDTLALASVDLSHNQLIQLPTWVFLVRSLTHADVSHNRLTFQALLQCWSDIEKEYFIYQNRRSASQYSAIGEPSQEKSINLRNNNISNVSLDNLTPQLSRVYPLVFSFYAMDASHNPIQCGCSAYTFHKFITSQEEFTTLPYQPNQYNAEHWKCEFPDKVKGTPIAKAPLITFKCPVKVTDCPTPCTCYQLPDSKNIDVNCSGLDLVDMPETVPQDTTMLHMSYNSLALISETKWYFSQLLFLDLSHNSLEEITGAAISSLGSVRELMLNHNRLAYLPINLTELSQLERLNLRINPLACDCSSRWLAAWYPDHASIVTDSRDVFCSTGVSAGKLLQETSPEDFACILVEASVSTVLKAGIVVACLVAVAATVVMLMACVVHRRQRSLCCYKAQTPTHFPVCINGGQYQLTVEESSVSTTQNGRCCKPQPL